MPQRFHDVSEVADNPNNSDGPYTLGTWMTFGVAGVITEIHWLFPTTLPSGPVEVGVYAETGPVLTRDPADVFVAPVAGQWNTVVLQDPYPVLAGDQRVPSVLTPNRYCSSAGYFGSPITRDDITVPAQGGRFNIGGSWGFPNAQFGNTAYFVDVTFVPDGEATSGVERSLDLRWGVRSSVSQPVDLRWAVRSLAAQTLDLRWGVGGAVTRSLDLRWRIEGEAVETLPPVVTQTISLSPGELRVQRKITLAFLRADAREIVIERRSRTSDGAGGTLVGDPVLQPPQCFRLLPQEDGATARTTAEGETATPEYMVFGRWDANLRRFDEFTINNRRYQVVFITENRQYQTKGEAIYLGEL